MASSTARNNTEVTEGWTDETDGTEGREMIGLGNKGCSTPGE